MLVGFMGLIGSGKSVSAQYLVDNYEFVERPFAEPLKRGCKELFLLTDDQLFGTQEQKATADPRWFNTTPRRIMQYVGTDLFRNNIENLFPGLEGNFFTHAFKIWYQEQIALEPKLCVVISDVRFQNEVDMIHELGGSVIKINRNCTPAVGISTAHSSETEMNKIKSVDYEILNNKTTDDLYKKIDEIISDIGTI